MLWTRSDLKRRAKNSLKKNYLYCMLAGLILLFAMGNQNPTGNSGIDTVQDVGGSYYDQLVQDPSVQMARRFAQGPMQVIWDHIIQVLGALSFVLVLLNVLVFAPIEAGGCRFFTENARLKDPKMKELFYAFRGEYYGKVVWTIVIRDIKALLWTLLFVIPGLVKMYEYRMVPYLIADHPEMSTEEAFARSREMMMGQKWNTFVLDMSFFLWDYLSLMTFGLAGIFFVQPYEHAASAELYLALSGQNMS